MSSAEVFVQSEVRGAAAVITLQRPEALNAFHGPMLAQLQAAVQAAANDPAVVGIVITGAGRGFCAGLDAAALAATADAGSGTRREPDPDELPGLFSYLVQVPKPVIAAVNGVAAGGGFVLVAKCDLRFASTSAAFTTVFSKRGLISEHGLSWLTPRQVGMGDALDLLWSSRKIDAAEAYRIGLVQRVVEPAALVADAVAYVDDLAANVSPNSLAVTKRLAYAHLGAEMRAAFTEADVATYEALDHPDVKEGVASFVERRPPRFQRLGEG